MAELITIGGQEYKKRNPWGAWGWSWLIIPYFVWYYRLNDEARRYLKDERIKPGLATLAQIVPIVHWISIWRTGERINRMQRQVGLPSSVLPILGIIASFFYFLHVVYYQSELNKVWDRAQAAATGATPPAGGGFEAPLPPPPAAIPEVPPPPPTGSEGSPGQTPGRARPTDETSPPA